MNLNLFMKNGIQGILRSMSRFYLGDPVGRAFLVKMLLQSKKAPNRGNAMKRRALTSRRF